MPNIRAPYTALILITGDSGADITTGLFQTLAPFAVEILDVEHFIIRDRFFLTALIKLDPAHSKAIESDLNAFALTQRVDIAIDYSEYKEILDAAIERLIVVGSPIRPDALSRLLSDIHGSIRNIRRLSTEPTAVEITFSGGSEGLSSYPGLDFALLTSTHGRKFVILDVDSTLIKEEVIELLGAKAGVEAEVREITELAMSGKIDFEESLRRRVRLLAGLPESVISQVRGEIHLSDGARELIQSLKRLGHEVGVVSGGFTAVIEPLLQELEITNYRANTLGIADGVLTGEVIGQVIDSKAKAEALKEFANEAGIALSNSVAIGDGANDIEMMKIAGTAISFNGKPILDEAADLKISNKRLDSALYLLGIY